MQNSNKSNPSDDFSYFDALLSYYYSIGWKPSRFRSRRTTFEKIIAHSNKTAKFINKLKSRQLACVNRAKSVQLCFPEYVKCGKETCEEVHGPYYYAYWKDPAAKKLKKKYIGTYMPENRAKLNEDNNKV